MGFENNGFLAAIQFIGDAGTAMLLSLHMDTT
jgi:gluconate:H+ symporter, GntP family